MDGLELPEFASFVLLDDVKGRAALARCFRRYLDIAAGANGAGFILESATWRASPDWGAKIGYDTDSIRRINGEAIALMRELRDEYKARIDGPIVISGCVGRQRFGHRR